MSDGTTTMLVRKTRPPARLARRRLRLTTALTASLRDVPVAFLESSEEGTE